MVPIPRPPCRRWSQPPSTILLLLLLLLSIATFSRGFTLDELPEEVFGEEDDAPEESPSPSLDPASTTSASTSSSSSSSKADPPSSSSRGAIIKKGLTLPRLAVDWSAVQQGAKRAVVPSLVTVAAGGLITLTTVGIRKAPKITRWPTMRPLFKRRPWRKGKEERVLGEDEDEEDDTFTNKMSKPDLETQFQSLQTALRMKEEELIEAHHARGEELASSRRTIETLKRDVDILISEKEDAARRVDAMKREHQKQLDRLMEELKMSRMEVERKKGDRGDEKGLAALEKRLSDQYQRMLDAERKIMADEAKGMVSREQAALEAERSRLQSIFQDEKERLQELFHQRLEEEVDVMRARYEDELRTQLDAWKERCTDAVKVNQAETQRRMMEYLNKEGSNKKDKAKEAKTK